MGMVEIIGISAGVLTTAGIIPQIFKAYNTKKVEGLSPVMFFYPNYRCRIMGVVWNRKRGYAYNSDERHIVFAQRTNVAVVFPI